MEKQELQDLFIRLIREFYTHFNVLQIPLSWFVGKTLLNYEVIEGTLMLLISENKISGRINDNDTLEYSDNLLILNSLP